MKVKDLFLATMLIALFVLYPIHVKADPPSASTECASVTDTDRSYLCQVKTFDKNKKYGYENKDHRNYYCSLIKDKDLQTYCYALAGNKASSCDLIINPDIEKECRASF